MGRLTITSVEAVEPKTFGNVREVHVHFDDGNTVKIGACLESWEQWGAPARHRWHTVSIANKCNKWLHGVGEFPQNFDLGTIK